MANTHLEFGDGGALVASDFETALEKWFDCLRIERNEVFDILGDKV